MESFCNQKPQIFGIGTLWEMILPRRTARRTAGPQAPCACQCAVSESSRQEAPQGPRTYINACVYIYIYVHKFIYMFMLVYIYISFYV